MTLSKPSEPWAVVIGFSAHMQFSKIRIGHFSDIRISNVEFARRQSAHYAAARLAVEAEQSDPEALRLRGKGTTSEDAQRRCDERMAQLLAGEQPHVPVVLLIGCYSEDLPTEVEKAGARQGVEVITVDYRAAEGAPRMHYQKDVRLILFKRWWRGVIAFPPCVNTALAGRADHEWKIANHLQWHGLQFYALMWCAPTDALIIEHSRSVVSEYLPLPTFVVHPYMFKGGGIARKETHLAHRGVEGLDLLPEHEWPPIDPATGLRGRCVTHDLFIRDAEKRERERARTPTAMATGLAIAITDPCAKRLLGHSEIPSMEQVFKEVAGRWVAKGNKLPPEWADPMARRPGGDEAFWLVYRTGSVSPNHVI